MTTPILNPVEVEYIESGTFQGGENDVFDAGIKRGDSCYVLSAEDWAAIKVALEVKWGKLNE